MTTPPHRGPARCAALLVAVVAGTVACDGASSDGDADATMDAPSDTVGTDARTDDTFPDGDASVDSDSGDATPDAVRAILVAPTRQVPGLSVPFRVTLVDDAGAIAVDRSGAWTVRFGDTDVAVALHRGVGSATVAMPPDAATFAADAADEARAVQTAEVDRTVAGELTDDDLAWGPDETVYVSGSVVVPANQTLTVAHGTTVLLEEDATVTVLGDIVVSGTDDAPVLWAAASTPAAWGGIAVHGAGTFAYALFVDGGGDDGRAWGHSDSQPILFGEPGSNLRIEACVFQDSPGKAVGALEARVVLADSLLARVDTGAELRDSHAEVSRSYFLDLPNDAARPDDPGIDDNDAAYFWGTLDDAGGEPLVSSVSDCVFVGGLDDAIDHNGAVLTVEGVWIEDFFHEGVAASNGGSVHVSDSWITACEQGIEVGGPYGGPVLTADHVVLVANDTNVRWGDSSDPDFASTIVVTNSVVADAAHASVLNHHVALGGPNLTADIRVSATLIDDEAWASGDGSILGEPTFSEDGLLAPGSLGAAAAEDGSSFGLRRPLGW